MRITPPPPKPIKNRLQKNINPGLIVGGLRYYISHILTINTFFKYYITLTYIHRAHIKSLNDSTLCL